MSYLTYKLENGREIEASDAGMLYNHDLFVKTLEERIEKNIAEGKGPLDDIDFPTDQGNGRVDLAKKLNNSDIFKKALRRQCRDTKHNPNKAILFTRMISQYSSDKKDAQELRKALCEHVDARLEKENGIEKLSGEAIFETYIAARDFPDEHAFWKNIKSEDIKDKKITPEQSELLIKKFDSLNRPSAAMVCLAYQSDLSKLKPEDKEKLSAFLDNERIFTSSQRDEIIEKSPLSNLTPQQISSRKNISSNDIIEAYKKRYPNEETPSSKDIYEFSKSINNPAAEKAKEELALKISSEIAASGSQKDAEEFGKMLLNDPAMKKHLVSAYENNPQKLADDWGRRIPSGLAFACKDSKLNENETTKHFIQQYYLPGSNDGQFLSQELEKLAAPENSGAGMDNIRFHAQKYLKSNQSDYEKAKETLAKNDDLQKQIDNLSAQLKIEEEAAKALAPLYDLQNSQKEVDVQTIIDRAIKTKNGQECPPLEVTAKKSSSIKRMFMGKKKRQAEDAQIIRQTEAYNKINQAIETFVKSPESKAAVELAATLANEKADGKQSSETSLQSYISRQIRTHSEKLEDCKNDKPADFMINRVQTLVTEYETITTGVEKVDEKIGKEIDLRRQAREDSGQKEIDAAGPHNSGSQIMALRGIGGKESSLPKKDLSQVKINPMLLDKTNTY